LFKGAEFIDFTYILFTGYQQAIQITFFLSNKPRFVLLMEQRDLILLQKYFSFNRSIILICDEFQNA
jgi:hypothetical protein